MVAHRGSHAHLRRGNVLRAGCAFDSSANETHPKSSTFQSTVKKVCDENSGFKDKMVAELRNGGVKFKVAKRLIGASWKFWRAVKTMVSESAVAGAASRAAGN